MLKPHQMKKVLIAGSKDILEAVIESLHDLRFVHIMEFKDQDKDFTIGTPTKLASSASEKLLKLRGAEKVLSLDASDNPEFSAPEKRIAIDKVRKELDSTLKAIDKEIMTKWEEKNHLENEVREVERKIEDIQLFASLPLKLEDLQPYNSINVIMGIVKNDPEIAIRSVTRNYEIFTAPTREGILMALFVDNEAQSKVAKVLLDLNFTEIRPPEGKGYVSQHVAKLQNEKAEALKNLSYHEDELRDLRKKHANLLLATEEDLSIEIQKAEVPMKFATSLNAFLIEGYIPEKRVDYLKHVIQKEFGENVYLEVETPDKKEDIPVALNNSKLPRNFEVLTDLIARPKYKEIDPTILMFIGLPIFFGIMLGDIAYGIIIIACIFLGVFTKMFNFLGMSSVNKQLNKILLLCGLWTIFFGFLFNEFFGFEVLWQSGMAHDPEAFYLIPKNIMQFPEFTIPRILVFGPTHFPIIRFENILPLLKTCIWIGLGHIFLGFAIGFRNLYVTHGFKDALFEKGSWMIIIIGGVILFYFLLRDMGGYVVLSYSSVAEIIGLAILIAGCVLLVMGEGIMALVHLPQIMSNSMSYTRILAIGLSSAGIAMAFNEMGTGLMGGGVGMMIFGWVVLFFGHFINILLGILGPGLHSLRLHYVEFYTKFYEGGGTPYHPFGAFRRFTKRPIKIPTVDIKKTSG